MIEVEVEVKKDLVQVILKESQLMKKKNQMQINQLVRKTILIMIQKFK